MCVPGTLMMWALNFAISNIRPEYTNNAGPKFCDINWAPLAYLNNIWISVWIKTYSLYGWWTYNIELRFWTIIFLSECYYRSTNKYYPNDKFLEILLASTSAFEKSLIFQIAHLMYFISSTLTTNYFRFQTCIIKLLI